MLKCAMFLLMASSSVTSVAHAQKVLESDNNAPIVVYGESLSESARSLNDCIHNKCAADKDIAATLRHAENLFVAGDYRNARRTLLASRSRNQRFSKAYPIQVADLLRANARVAEHLGEGDAARIGALDVLSTLKAGLPADDARTLSARVELADSFARFGQFKTAANEYRAVAQRGNELGLPKVEGYGLLRLASMYTALAENDPATYRLSAKRAVEELISNRNPQLIVFANAARVIKARADFRNGDSRAVDALIASYKLQSPTQTPTLLYAPNIDVNSGGGREFGNNSFGVGALQLLPVNNFEDQWVDIGFWVGADGNVRDVSILRESEHFSNHWTGSVLKSIGGRRYAPIAVAEGDPGIFRVERYTYTSRWTERTGSRIRARSYQPRIEALDLSPVAGNPDTESGPLPGRTPKPV